METRVNHTIRIYFSAVLQYNVHIHDTNIIHNTVFEM